MGHSSNQKKIYIDHPSGELAPICMINGKVNY